MAEPQIPEPLRLFILRNFDSIAELEALLLLRREPGAWDVTRAASRLYIEEGTAAQVLARLCANGLLRQQGQFFSYDGQSGEHRRIVDDLADCYKRRLITVTNLIHGKQAGVRQFADAFRFRRDR